jgi:hypothetical protein
MTRVLNLCEQKKIYVAGKIQRVFENGVLRRIFGAMRDDGEQIKNDAVGEACSTPGKMRSAYKIWSENLK